jgi:adenylyltransferase/sulfurtransferase
MAFVPGMTPCLRCIFEQMPPPGSSPTCDTSGIIGPIVHAVAAIEAAEALKILTGHPEQLNRKLTTMDLWENRVLTLDFSKTAAAPDCPACGLRRFEFLAGTNETKAWSLCGRNAVQIRRDDPVPVDFEPLASRLSSLAQVSYNSHLLRASMGEIEIALFQDGRAIIRGTQDVDEARRIYAKLIGM